MTMIITEFDRQRLKDVLTVACAQTVTPDKDLAGFLGAYYRAIVVPSDEVPRDVVTMNSRVDMYDMEYDVTETYTLVYPVDSDIFTNRLSILNPMGMAILGRRQGEIARWRSTNGEHHLQLMKLVFQPEREGLLNL